MGYWLSPAVLGRNGYYADNLILPATCTPEEHQMGLRIAEALSGASSEDQDLRLFHAISVYRVGRYSEALRRLESWRLRQRVLPIVAQMGQYFLLGRFAPLLDDNATVTTEDDVRVTAFLATAHHRLGNPKPAREALDHLRQMGEISTSVGFDSGAWKTFDSYKNLIHEAETLIEGKPHSGK